MADPQIPEAPDAYVVYEDADLPEPDLDAPLIEHRYERTVPAIVGAPYDLLGTIRARRAKDAAAGDFDAGGHTEVVAPGWWCEPDDLPRAPKPLAKRLLAQGWDVLCCASIAYVTPTYYVGSTEKHSKGDLRYRDHDLTSWSVQAVLRARETPVAAFWATWVTREEVGRKTATNFLDAATHDVVLGRQYVDAVSDLTEWLAVFER